VKIEKVGNAEEGGINGDGIYYI